MPAPGMVPMMKRNVMTDYGKCSLPMYQPTAAMAYHQMALTAMQLQQPAYVPIASESVHFFNGNHDKYSGQN